MAEKKKENQAGATSFRRVTKSFQTAGGAHRGAAKVTLNVTGMARTNSEGKEMTQSFIRDQGGDPNNFSLAFGGNEEKGQLALYMPTPEDTGMMKVSIYKNTLTFHAGGAFEEHPKLRPATKLDCQVSRSVDADGIPCLVVQITGGAPTRTVKRIKKENQ